jgi:iron-sulfur cluster repair protein YtfE (RIC family)
MSVTSPAPLLDQIMDHHDYVWARLPFVPPMALAVARRRCEPSTDELVRLIVKLQTLLLDHLAREERLLAAQAAAATVITVGERMHTDHVLIGSVLARIREVAAGCQWHPQSGVADLERAFCDELAQLHEHVTSQIGLEEALARSRCAHRLSSRT